MGAVIRCCKDKSQPEMLAKKDMQKPNSKFAKKNTEEDTVFDDKDAQKTSPNANNAAQAADTAKASEPKKSEEIEEPREIVGGVDFFSEDQEDEN